MKQRFYIQSQHICSWEEGCFPFCFSFCLLSPQKVWLQGYNMLEQADDLSAFILYGLQAVLLFSHIMQLPSRMKGW